MCAADTFPLMVLSALAFFKTFAVLLNDTRARETEMESSSAVIDQSIAVGAETTSLKTTGSVVDPSCRRFAFASWQHPLATY